MTSKTEILNTIRNQRAPAAELPSLDGNWIRYEDPFAQFRQVLDSVGGRCERVASIAEGTAMLFTIPEFAVAKQIVSTVAGFEGNVQLSTFEDPHQLETIDWAIMRGEFGVAENGAIWVTDQNIKHRAIFFIAQHLVLVVPGDQIVHNMAEAYERISIDQTSWSGFISGPSKTADIEQSLVIGAHGPRSLTVFCVDEAV